MTSLTPSEVLVCGGFFFIPLFLTGLILILIYNKNKKKAGFSQQWPFVQGMITVSEIKQSTSTDEDGNKSFSYYPRVEYSYIVNGQSFSGKQVAFGAVKGYNTPAQAQEQANRYAMNAAVWVFTTRKTRPSLFLSELKAAEIKL